MNKSKLWQVKTGQYGVHKQLLLLKGVHKGLGLTPPLSLIFYKNFIICAKEINCFRILLLVNLFDLKQTPQNKFACKFPGTLSMSQKIIIRFWFESGLSSASRNHIIIFADLSSTTHV